jgi:hypothetical protein
MMIPELDHGLNVSPVDGRLGDLPRRVAACFNKPAGHCIFPEQRVGDGKLGTLFRRQ